MSALGEGEDRGPGEGLNHMLFFGGVTYSLTIPLVTIYILIELSINADLYIPSYMLGTFLFIALNAFAHLALVKTLLNRKRKWWVLILIAVAFLTLLWVFQGLAQPWRTFAIAGIGYAGIFMIGLSWLIRPEDGPAQ